MLGALRGPEDITSGPDGNLWFAELGGYIAKITTSGAISEYPLPPESGASGITQGSDGNIWYTAGTSKIGEIPTSATITEPTEARAPVPAGVSCSWKSKPGEGGTPTEMQKGCRALEFKYATETTATGEAESEWGQYKHRLMKVTYVGYNPASKAMVEIAVAEYLYDKQGQLRSEWDPRTSPALKTDYSYDEEGHVTAIDPPGQEPWTLTYGTASGDSGTGRLVKATRAQPAAGTEEEGVKKLKEQKEAEKNTEAPKITGSPEVGAPLSVSNGKWSGTTVVFGYQWYDCNSEAAACMRILGATNASYSPATSDAGHTLVAQVTATNGAGAVSTFASATAVVKVAEEYALPSGSHPFGITTGPDGNAWFTDTSTGKAGKITTSGSITEYAAESHEPEGITSGSDGKLWFVEHSIGHMAHMTTVGSLTEYTLGRTTLANVGIVAGPDENLWFTESEAGYIGKINTKDEVLGEYKLPTSSKPYGIAVGSDKNLWFTDYGTGEIGKVTTSGTITEYKLPSGSEPYSIAPGPEGDLWFTDYGTSKIGKINPTSGAINEYALPSGSNPRGITAGSDGNLWFTEAATSKIGRISTTGTVTEYALASGSEPYGITTGPDKNIWFTEYGTNKIGKIDLYPAAGEAGIPQPGSTIDYNVPLEGTGLPDMGVNETTHNPEPEKWGQTDDPVEATAILPPDSPQGWPAATYKRATIYYLDELGRTVNTSQPSTAPYGSISTSEYNEFNDVTRTLSPDNRATALAAGEKSEEVSKLLDTENRYNEPECQVEQPGEVADPGTRLCETLGPQHEVKYVEGKEQKEALARNHEEFYYDQGVPKEKPFDEETYDLVTETSDLALLANREDREVRTTKTSYSGQGNLGWKLREPTSVTVDPKGEAEPNGLNLTRTTLYNETTGQVVETRGATAEHTLTFASKFGEKGTEPGKLKSPWGIAVNAEGDLWVSDTGNDRIEEFNPEGKYLGKIGEAGSEAGKLSEPEGIAIDSKGNIWIADAGNNRIDEFKPEGKYVGDITATCSEGGKLKAPAAIAFDAKGNVWVADTGNNHIEKFNTEGKCVSEFGSAGSEPGQLKEPKGIAIHAEGSEEHVWVADTANNRIQEFSTTGSLLGRFASTGTGEGQLSAPQGIGFDGSGDLWVADGLNGRVESFTPCSAAKAACSSSSSGFYSSQLGWKGSESGQLNEPRAIAVDAHGNMWVTDSANNRVEEWSPGANAHDSKIIYYSSEENKEYANCGKHPEWAGLTCETRPAKQPELGKEPGKLANLPVSTVTYNMWLEPETTEEKFVRLNSEKHEETTIRTKKESYDEAGRLKTSETVASGGSDKTLPPVTLEYNKETGALIKQTTTVESKEQAITSEYNRLGQLVKYTDSDGNTATYKYAGAENDNLLEEITDSHEETKESKESKSYQRYYYEETTKAMNKLVDSTAGTFTASYDAELNMTSEVFPNSMAACYTRNSVGETTGVQYIKTTSCSEGEPAVWYSDTRMPSIHGQTLSQTSTLASETYTYDPAERLTETQETPAGEGCTTRAYAYDEESNRASLTTRKPGSKGECETEGGTSEGHNYDEANRLTDSGITYEAFGNVEKLPAADAEGHELTTSFYVDGAVGEQTQNSVTHKYNLDPEGRDSETITGSKKVISHYDAPGEAIAWTSEEEGKKTTRDIPGMDGTLTATQTNNEAPVLQLHDLQGDTVATIGDSTSETKLLSTYNSTEFGAPNAGKAPPPYAWLGAGGVKSELASGVITEGATSYVPQTGRSLQAEEVEPPGLPDGSGAGAPVTFQEEPWVMQGATREANEAPGLEAGREREAFIAACMANPESCGGIDPPHIVVLFTPAEAIALGEALCNCAVVKASGQAIEYIARKIGLAGAGTVFEEAMESGAAEGFGKELLNCGRYLNSNTANRCALEIDTLEIPVIDVDSYVPTGIHIGLCFYYKKSFQGKKRGLQCPNNQYYKPGSY